MYLLFYLNEAGKARFYQAPGFYVSHAAEARLFLSREEAERCRVEENVFHPHRRNLVLRKLE